MLKTFQHSRVPFWLSTTRISLCGSSQYKRTICQTGIGARSKTPCVCVWLFAANMLLPASTDEIRLNRKNARALDQISVFIIYIISLTT